MFWIGVAEDRIRNGTDASRRAVAALAARLFAVNLHKLRNVNIIAE